MIQFVFTEEEFSLKLFQNQFCVAWAEDVLSYSINQENKFVTYLPLPEVTQVNGREYTTVFIRYVRGN
jgi:hypothetical protein